MKISEVIVKVLRVICSILLIALIIVVFLQVVLRYFFSRPLAWSDELSRLLLIYVASFGVTLIFYTKAGHPAVTFGVERLPERAQRIIEICKNMVLGVLMVYVAYFGVTYSLKTHRFLSAVLHYHTSIKYGIFPLTMGLMAFKSFLNGVENTRELRESGARGKKG